MAPFGFMSRSETAPQSPDLNILDLGFFNLIQSIKDELSETSVDSFIDAVTIHSTQEIQVYTGYD